MDFPGRLVSKILLYNDLKSPLALGITPEMLPDPAQAWLAHILEFHNRNGVLPSSGHLERNFPSFVLVPDVSESWEELAEEIRTGRQYKTITDSLRGAAAALGKKDLLEAQRLIQSCSVELARESVGRSAFDIFASPAAFREQYEARKTMGAVNGIPSGWGWLDNVTLGWQPSDFVLIVGPYATGKSFLLYRWLLNAWLGGKRVLLITLEMIPPAIQRRVIAMFAQVPPKALRRGQLMKEQEEFMFAKLDEAAVRGIPFEVVNQAGVSAPTVSWVRGLIEKHDPDIVAIDGHYKLQDQLKAKDYNRYYNLSRETKDLCNQTGKPLLATSQLINLSRAPLGAGRKKKEGGELDDVAFGASYAQDPDVVLIFHRNEQLELDRKALLKFGKVREDERPLSKVISWDLDTGDLGRVIEDGEMAEENAGSPTW